MAETLENLLIEERTFPPSAQFAAQANAQAGVHAEAEAAWLEFWRTQALERIDWFAEPTRVLNDDNPPFFKWFEDGELNLSYNCVDRHLADHGDQVAYHWVGEPGDTLTITYRDLYNRVCQFANALVGMGVKKGDRIAIYMGMIPDLPVAMLACARIGAVHSVVFGGFSSDSLADRILDADARVVITQDGSWRAGSVVPLKENTDVALERCPEVSSVVVVRRTENPVTMVEGRDTGGMT